MSDMTLIDYIKERSPICTDLNHIQHLIASSTYSTKNGRSATPDYHTLMLGECIGGRTIMVGEDKWLFSMDKNIILKETPDELFGKFPRIDYDFQLFMGDENGFLIAKATGTLTHAVMVRRLFKEGNIEQGPLGFDIVKVPSWCRQVGNPKRMDVFHSGSILPKQNPGDVPAVDGTYVSFWKNVGYASLRHHVKNYCVKNFEGPFRCEVPVDDEDAWSTFQEIDF